MHRPLPSVRINGGVRVRPAFARSPPMAASSTPIPQQPLPEEPAIDSKAGDEKVGDEKVGDDADNLSAWDDAEWFDDEALGSAGSSFADAPQGW